MVYSVGKGEKLWRNMFAPFVNGFMMKKRKASNLKIWQMITLALFVA